MCAPPSNLDSISDTHGKCGFHFDYIDATDNARMHMCGCVKIWEGKLGAEMVLFFFFFLTNLDSPT